LFNLIVRFLAWAMAFWPHHSPRGKHRRGAQAPSGRPLPVAVREQSTPAAWPPRVPSRRTHRDARNASPTSAPPTEWVVAGPLVRAYVVLHEERQHSLSSAWAWVGRPPARKG
jgi:hypothetical protein